VRAVDTRDASAKHTAVMPVVGECDDGFLNDNRSTTLTTEDVASALDSATVGPVEECVVGAGTGGEIAWASHKTPLLFDGEPAAELTARDAATEWLARTGRTDDVLFGYEPLYLGAWERRRELRQEVVPRADPRLALDVLRRAHRPLGRGVWVFDASDTNNSSQRQSIDLVYPEPAAGFEAQAWGPYLVIRTIRPTKTVEGYLEAAALAQGVGKRLYIGDADVNLVTVQLALARLGQTRSRSTTSR